MLHIWKIMLFNVKHRAKLYIDILTACLLLCFLHISAKSQTSIISLIQPQDTVINFGPCAIGDTLFARFEIRTDYDSDLYMIELKPSFAISISSLDNYPEPQHYLFDHLFKNFPYTFRKGDIDTFAISFKLDPESPLEQYPYGWKYADLEMGLTRDINSSDSIEIGIKYLLKAKKTPLYADGFENNYTFDSVYVNPIVPKKHNWRVKNVRDFDVILESQESKLLSDKKTDDEFTVQNRFSQTEEIEIRSKNIVTWDISYSPKDVEADSILVELFYTREPGDQDTIILKAVGQGVRQKIDFVNLNYPFSNDTIYLGDVPIYEKQQIKASIYNDGNLPFGKKDIYIENIGTSSAKFNWNNHASPMSDNTHLQLDKFDSLKFDLTIEEAGEFLLAYTIHSDIADRKIFGTPDSVIYKRLYISGRCVAPKLNAITDTINMGNVVLFREECPSGKDTIYKVFNSGDYTLEVEFALEPEYPNTGFEIAPRNLTVAPKETKEITIAFKSDIADEYESDLLVKTNEKYPKETIRVPLRAMSIEPVQAKLILPDIKSKPGRVVSLPIVLENNSISPAVLAGTYTDSLFYNPSLLKFRGYSLLGTASEFVPNPVIMEYSPGNLHIDISLQGEETFLARDTIIKLLFETYLGDAVETPIRVSNPKFGNSNCTDIIDIPESNIHNSTFTLDSICGIEYIVSPGISSLFEIKEISPVPADQDLKLEFNVAAKTFVEFRVYNTYGETLISEQRSLMPKGLYERNLNISELPVGIYYLEFRAGIYQEIKSFIINR